MRGLLSVWTAVVMLCVILMHLVDVTSSQGNAAAASNAARRMHESISDVLNSHPNVTALLALLCAGADSNAVQCRGAPDYRKYYSGNGTATSVRRKRQISRFWPSWRPFQFPSWYPFPTRPTYSPVTGGGATVFCPQQVDQSLVYSLSASSAGYPAVEIAAELENNPILPCLESQIVLPTDPPILIYEDFIQSSSYACPFSTLRLWQYYSLNAGSTCWVLQTFQENILYSNCSTRFCNCNPTTTSTSSNFWSPSYLTRGLCTTEYRQVSVWSYCSNLPTGARIVRDRIIIPVGCRCQWVRCSTA